LDIYVSLDFTDLEKALEIASKVVRAGIKHLEVGTPLIKSRGISAITTVKKRFPGVTVFADMKTADTGRLEASMAFDAGADIVSVLGVASDSTIAEALEVASDRGKTILVDMIGLKKPVERAIEVKKIGAKMICFHTGIDEGTIVENTELLRDAKSRLVNVLVGAAGGITVDTITQIKPYVDFVHVGRAITKAEDPYSSAVSFIKAVEDL